MSPFQLQDFGRQVLGNTNSLSDCPADCSKIGSKVDCRIQSLDGLIFHEIYCEWYKDRKLKAIHQNCCKTTSVTWTSWHMTLFYRPPKSSTIEDCKFCGVTKTYGPWQVRMLRDGDYGKALIINENLSSCNWCNLNQTGIRRKDSLSFDSIGACPGWTRKICSLLYPR